MPHKNEGNYDANSLRALKGLEPVREHPGMYIGPTDEKGLHCLVREVIDNSIDEFVMGFGKKITIDVTPDGLCEVRDFGRGIQGHVYKAWMPSQHGRLELLVAENEKRALEETRDVDDPADDTTPDPE